MAPASANGSTNPPTACGGFAAAANSWVVVLTVAELTVAFLPGVVVVVVAEDEITEDELGGEVAGTEET